jgi:ribosome-associated protein
MDRTGWKKRFSTQQVCVSITGMLLTMTPHIRIPEEDIQIEYVRASGPGGQNINKVATAVQLRFDVRRSPALPGDVRRRLEKLAGRRLTSEGVLVLDARRHRTQEQNRADAIDRLRELIAKAAVPPRRRRATKPTRSSVERRLNGKHKKAVQKMHRGKQFSSED